MFCKDIAEAVSYFLFKYKDLSSFGLVSKAFLAVSRTRIKKSRVLAQLKYKLISTPEHLLFKRHVKWVRKGLEQGYRRILYVLGMSELNTSEIKDFNKNLTTKKRLIQTFLFDYDLQNHPIIQRMNGNSMLHFSF